MTSKPTDFNGFPIAPSGELCWQCLALLMSYLKLLPKPRNLTRRVELMQRAATMKHDEFHPMTEMLYKAELSRSEPQQ